MDTNFNDSPIPQPQRQEVELSLIPMEGEVRVEDVNLAEWLGFNRPSDIRKLIRRHQKILNEINRCATMAHRPEGGGKAYEVFYLDRQQAMFITTQSGTPKALGKTRELIERFVAMEKALEQRGVQQITPADLQAMVMQTVEAYLSQQLQPLMARIEELHIDPSLRVSRDYKPMLEVVKAMGVPPKKRRSLVQRLSARGRRWFSRAGRGGEIRESPETGRYLFHVRSLAEFMVAEGNAIVAAHKAAVAGQGVLPFKPKAAT